MPPSGTVAIDAIVAVYAVTAKLNQDSVLAINMLNNLSAPLGE